VTDHNKATGSSGTMKIRDTGTYVEFWLIASTGTHDYNLQWAYVVNGVTSGWKSFRFEGGGVWQKIYRVNVTYTQTVTFKLGITSTPGLGGPTTFSVQIVRPKKPNPPSAVTLLDITSSTVLVTFTDGANNGAIIDSRQIGYGTSYTTPQKTISSDKNTTITGLTPGADYFFWARTHNSEGWSSWSERSTTPLATPVQIKLFGVYRTAIPYVKADGVWRPAQTWIRTVGIWKESM